MRMYDYQQMQSLEQERIERTLDVLARVATGASNYNDAAFLAGELGLRHLWLQPKEAKHGQAR